LLWPSQRLFSAGSLLIPPREWTAFHDRPSGARSIKLSPGPGIGEVMRSPRESTVVLRGRTGSPYRALLSLFCGQRIYREDLVSECVIAVRRSSRDYLSARVVHSRVSRPVGRERYRYRVDSDSIVAPADESEASRRPAAEGISAGQPAIPPGAYWDRLRAARDAQRIAAESLEIDESPIQSD
jgi:hypothetical protein